MTQSGFGAATRADPELAGEAAASVGKRILIPHDGGQKEVLASTARFETVCAGRRWGKTKVASRKLLRNGIKNPGSLNWWVANTYKNVARGYREFLTQLPPELLAKTAPAISAVNLELELKNGTRFEFYSGGSPEALAGAGVDYVIVDEAALIEARTWEQLIRPTLMDTNGRAMLISTPRGRNWFWRLWNFGQDPSMQDYASWRFPTSSNPYVSAAEIEEARRTLPDIIFRQEIEAEFVSSAASIFNTAADGVVVDGLAEPRGSIYMGVDLGKKEDFTVISACREEDRLPVYHDKFNTIKWPEQRGLVRAAVEYLERYPGVENVTVLIDSTGGSVGDVVYDDLEDEDLDVIGVNFSGVWKERAVKLLAADLERGEAHILESQREEFEAYEYEITDAGKYKFAAVTGHDDEVSAKLLEHWGVIHEGTPGINILTESEPEEPTIIVPDSTRDLMWRPEAWS